MNSTAPFSFEELATITQVTKDPSFITAHDDIKLAYYTFLPEQPKALVIFYHGGGLYTNSSYQYIAQRLQDEHGIGSYFVDIRGHGHSGGTRGDAPRTSDIMEDVTTILNLVHSEFPTTEIYLTGHSSGAALILNYNAWSHRKADLYVGNILLAPYLGPRVGVEQPHAVSFVKKVRLWIYILNLAFKIRLFQHIPAVYFNYPPELLKQDPLIVTNYSFTMSCATTPDNPQHIFEHLDKPTALYIGSEDEQFAPEKVVSFAQFNRKNLVSAEIITDAKHLSILLQADQLIAEAVEKFLNSKRI